MGIRFVESKDRGLRWLKQGTCIYEKVNARVIHSIEGIETHKAIYIFQLRNITTNEEFIVLQDDVTEKNGWKHGILEHYEEE